MLQPHFGYVFGSTLKFTVLEFKQVIGISGGLDVLVGNISGRNGQLGQLKCYKLLQFCSAARTVRASSAFQLQISNLLTFRGIGLFRLYFGICK